MLFYILVMRKSTRKIVKKPRTRIGIVLDTDLYQQAREMARLDKRDFSSFIAVILERAVSMREAA
jgi:hypothetical protein